jgi:hypothetical protein
MSLGVLLYFLGRKSVGFRRRMLDLYGFAAACHEVMIISYNEIAFRNANILASHKVGSYNHFHWLSQSGNLRMSPPPSSFGGLNPNRSFGFFFARCPAASNFDLGQEFPL